MKLTFINEIAPTDRWEEERDTMPAEDELIERENALYAVVSVDEKTRTVTVRSI